MDLGSRLIKKVSVLGLWHLGSVTSACLSALGYKVMAFDPDPRLVDDLSNGRPPLFEPGLKELIAKNLSTGQLRYTPNLKEALRGSSRVLISFDTPLNEKDQVDLSPIYDVILKSLPFIENDSILIISSQVPIGTCEQIGSLIRKKRPSLRLGIAYVPENLRLGQGIESFMHPDMIVIGSDDTRTLEKVYRFFSIIDVEKVRVDLKTAEMVKHAINTYLAMQISLINEIANLSAELGADGVKVGEAMRLDSRIGPKARLTPGLGFSGGTLARDLTILTELGNKVGCDMHVVRSILRVNKNQNRTILAKLHKKYDSINGLSIGILGLTYKPGTSTLRRSAALEIISDLVRRGAKVKAYDPKADLNEIKGRKRFEICTDPLTVAKDTEALIILTAWPEFKKLNYSNIRSIMKNPFVIDAQNFLDAEELVSLGFEYLSVGRELRKW